MKRVPVTDGPRQGSSILARLARERRAREGRAREGRADAAIAEMRRQLDSLHADLDAAVAGLPKADRDPRVVRVVVEVAA